MTEKATSESSVDIDRLEADFKADPGNFVPLARAYLERNLPRQAIEVCKHGLRHNPNAAQGLLALGMAYYQAYDDTRAEAVLRKVTRISPETAAAFRALGEIYLDRGQEQKALAELSRALEIEPRDAVTRRLLESLGEKPAALRTRDGRPLELWPVRKEPAQTEPARPFWHLVAQVVGLAVVMALVIVWYWHYVDKNTQIRNHLTKAAAVVPRDNFTDLKEAEKELLQAYQLDNDHTSVNVRLAAVQALLWLDHGQTDRKTNLEKLSAWMEAEELPNPERFATAALLQITAGKTQEAEKFLDATINRAVDQKDIFLDASILGTRALALLRQGRLKDAREDFIRAARFSAESPHYHAAIGDLFLREGEYERAARYFLDALRVNPDHLLSNLRLAYAFIQSGKNLDRARKIVEDLFDPQRQPEERFSPPLNGMRYLVRAELHLLFQDVPAASEWLRKSLQAYEANAEAHGLAGRLAALNKDAAKVRSEFARALEIDPYLPRLYFDRSESLFFLGEKSEAIEKLREFERHLQPTVAYHVMAGNLYLRMDDLQSAMNEYQKAVKVDELDPDGHYHMGLCYKAMGEKLGSGKEVADRKREIYNNARQKFEDTLILPGGERGEVYHQMGRIYLDSEDADNALDNLGKAALMMQKAGESTQKIAEVYDDVARVFAYLGGTEGEKQKKIFEMKARGLREGKSMEQVEREATEQQKASAKKGRGRHRAR